MKCNVCGKDKDFFTELHRLPRTDRTPNCGGLLIGRKPKYRYICDKCLESNNNKR